MPGRLGCTKVGAMSIPHPFKEPPAPTARSTSRIRRGILAGTALVASTALTAVAVAPASAAPAASAASGTDVRTTLSTGTASALPALDPALLREAIAGLPNATMTGALVTIGGAGGRWSGTSGVADVRTGRQVPSDGTFRIGSATKMFTAVVVLQLVAERRVDLDRSVQHYLPGLLPASYPTITVGQLLDHTSGLPISEVDAPASDPAWFVEHRFEGWTPEQVVDSAVAGPMAFAPGTQQRYNGVNYFVAGMLVEKVTGHSYAHEVRHRITRPLGLRDTYVPNLHDMTVRGRHAHGYVTVDGALVDITEQNAWSWAEGGMVSSSADLTRFVRAVFRGRLLPRAELARMFTVPDVDYTGGGSNCRIGPDAGKACFSMGLTKTTFPNGVTAWGKSGSVPGYTTAAFATRDLRRVMVYSLTPTGNRDGSEGSYVGKIAAATFDPDLFPRG